MEYEGQICRGPMERASYMLPISVGCSYNQCRFCTLFKHLTVPAAAPGTDRGGAGAGSAPWAEIPSRCFWGTGTPSLHRTERLLFILEHGPAVLSRL